MTHEPTGTEHLILWRLAVAGGGDWNKGLKPALDAPRRKTLIAGGFLAEESRKREGEKRASMYLALTDRGWAWLSEHLGGEMDTRANSLETFLRLLVRLKAHIDGEGLSLAEFLCPPSREGPEDVEARIVAAYGRLAGGRANVRVRLALLRRELADLARPRLDEALLAMDRGGKAALYRFDNPLEMADDDREAALRTPAGDARHLVYLGGSDS